MTFRTALLILHIAVVKLELFLSVKFTCKLQTATISDLKTTLNLQVRSSKYTDNFKSLHSFMKEPLKIDLVHNKH